VASGAERVLSSHVSGLLARGHAVTVVSGARARPAASAPSRDGSNGREPADACVHEAIADQRLHVTRVGWSAATPWSALRAARAACARGPFDVVVAHHPYPAWRLIADRAFRDTPRVSMFHSGWAEEYAVRRPGQRGLRHAAAYRLRLAIERRVLRAADRVIPMSRFMAERATALHALDRTRIRIVPGGVDRARFRPVADRRAERAALGLPATGQMLLTVRNLEPRMGLEALVAAMPAILARCRDAFLVIGSNGPLRRELEASVAALGLADRVRFTGFVAEADLPRLYAAADLFVLPSQQLEGFGLVTVEALACGTPVLGTRVGATPELLEPLDPELLVETATPEALADGVIRVLSRGDRDVLGARCRAHTEAYDWSRVIEALEREYGAVTGVGSAQVSR